MQGYQVNHKREARLLRTRGLEAIYAKPSLSQPGAQQQRYPYLRPWHEDRASESTVEHGYHLHSPGTRVQLFGSHPGLV